MSGWTPGGRGSIVAGDVASGAADSGNPVKIGGVFNPPTLLNGQRGDVQVTTNGFLIVDPTGHGTVVASDNAASVLVNTPVGYGGNYPLWIAASAWGGSGWDRLRTASVFKTGTASAAGSTSIWTPAAGKKFRLMAYVIYLTAEATRAVAGDIDVLLQDAGSGIGLGWTVYVPAAVVAGEIAYTSGWITLGNGALSAAANNALQVNLSASLTAGTFRVVFAGTEE